MAIVLRLPKRQVRLALAAVLVLALGAGVAAQTASSPPEASTIETAAVPTDPAAVEPVVEPQAPATVQGQEQPGTQEPADQGAGQQGEQQAPPPAQQGEQQAPPPAQQGQQATPTRPDLLTPEEREALQLVERLIQEQEGVLMGTGFDYNPGGRRDPFRSLLAEITAVSAPTVRPFGLPGFLIGEVDLKATAEVRGRWHAMVIAPDQRAYFLEVGTELFDGHVMQIGPGEVIFEQIVPDLTGARRTRQVTKRLRTTDGGGETP
jgi:hypothetical protein